jgi:diguanylate cyclase (GGDEF)-like protein
MCRQSKSMQIVFQFDIRTIAVFIALTFFVQATAIGAEALLIRELKQYRGVTAALLANLCAAASLMLRLFANRLPEYPILLLLSNALLLAGPGLFYIALGQFTGFRYSKIFVIVVIGVVVSVLAYFLYLQEDTAIRIIVLSLGSITLVGLLIYQLWQTQKRTSLRLSANLMLTAFISYEVFLIIRTVSLIQDPPRNAASLSPVQSATFLLSFAISIFWSTGFILMVSQRLRNDLMEMATMDVLTRIPNRRATQAFLERELARTQRHQGKFSVLLIDIDNFKQVNDNWGHDMGDYVLLQTAGIFQSMIRKQDWVGRWGGEEFLMILPGPSEPEALAERVRGEVAIARFGQGEAASSFGITVSIGVTCSRGSEQIDEILRHADLALYQAKQTKNTVSMLASST